MWQQEHKGQWGDVEWHKIGEFEPDGFYVTGIPRDVTAIENVANISINEIVCAASLFSVPPNENCSRRVAASSWSCTNQGITYHRLVLMDGEATIPGDSGGPWFIATRAYGSTKGTCETGPLNQDMFSVADLYQEALGVQVKITP